MARAAGEMARPMEAALRRCAVVSVDRGLKKPSPYKTSNQKENQVSTTILERTHRGVKYTHEETAMIESGRYKPTCAEDGAVRTD